MPAPIYDICLKCSTVDSIAATVIGLLSCGSRLQRSPSLLEPEAAVQAAPAKTHLQRCSFAGGKWYPPAQDVPLTGADAYIQRTPMSVLHAVLRTRLQLLHLEDIDGQHFPRQLTSTE